VSAATRALGAAIRVLLHGNAFSMGGGPGVSVSGLPKHVPEAFMTLARCLTDDQHSAKTRWNACYALGLALEGLGRGTTQAMG